MDGIILIDKPLNYTSHDIVGKVRRVLHTKKVGHCGTLDPQATGVLVVCVNKATKAIQFLTSDEKTYIASVQLGYSTDTYDREGEIVEKKDYKNDVSFEQVKSCLESFKGKQKQMPPIYSAIKVNGKKLYEYAREGKEVEIQSRDIEILDIELIDFKEDKITFKAHCSKGTYIRSLCVDIAAKLGYPGCMVELRRIQSGAFTIDQCVTLEQLENNEFTMLSIEEGLKDMKELIVEDTSVVFHGKKIESNLDGYVAIKDKDKKILAIYEQIGENTLKNVRGLW